ncbi:Uu.00g002330.m01.CDS01 [Anthostomella pinea]|uniref:Uu.00g002330.m01.CDS01 n=1 Tax=Anthostomella pinea TaxID=933095 RepID=A0AAI8VJM1_9PEZI|nr:Uu.00g002330.m01.CDS01 [Anthostomella pinea]
MAIGQSDAVDQAPKESFRGKATFGFELEFLALFKEFGTKTPWEGGDGTQCTQPILEEPPDINKTGSDHELHMRRLHHFGGIIAQKLTEAGMYAEYREKGHPSADEVEGQPADDVKLGPFRGYRYTAYENTTVIPEETMIWTDPLVDGRRMLVRPAAQEGYFWLGFEVVSKAYLWQERQRAEAHLERTCRVLRANYRLSVNTGITSVKDSSRCSVHIYWGIRGLPLPLHNLKRLLTLLWVAEAKLLDLHATWKQEAIKYAAPLQKRTNMAMDKTDMLPSWVDEDDAHAAPWRDEMERNVPPFVSQALHNGKAKVPWLWRAETVEDLAKLVGESDRSRKAAIAVTEHLPPQSEFWGKVRKSQLNTVEFRHMQGSLEPELVAAWIHVTARITEVCVDFDADEFHDLLGKVANCVDHGGPTAVYKLLDVLGVQRAVSQVFESHNQDKLDEEAKPEKAMFLHPMEAAHAKPSSRSSCVIG